MRVARYTVSSNERRGFGRNDSHSPGRGIIRVPANTGRDVPAKSHARAGKGAALVGARRPLVGGEEVGRIRHDADIVGGNEVRCLAAILVVGAILIRADKPLISLGTNIRTQPSRTEENPFDVPQSGRWQYEARGFLTWSSS